MVGLGEAEAVAVAGAEFVGVAVCVMVGGWLVVGVGLAAGV